MMVVESFQFDGEAVICPNCQARVLLPDVRKLVSFLCPRCETRPVLREAQYHVLLKTVLDPTLKPGKCPPAPPPVPPSTGG